MSKTCSLLFGASHFGCLQHSFNVARVLGICLLLSPCAFAQNTEQDGIDAGEGQGVGRQDGKNASITAEPQLTTKRFLQQADTLSASDFDRQSGVLVQQVLGANHDPSVLGEALLKRLRLEKFTSDEAILNIVDAQTSFEGVTRPEDAAPNEGRERWANSKHLIDSILSLLYKRPIIEARLYGLKATLQQSEQQTNGAKAHQNAVRLLTPVSLAIDLQRISSVAVLAANAEATDNKQEAMRLYEEVSSYPWYGVAASDVLNVIPSREKASRLEQFRALYIQAGQGLIRVNEGNLEALQGLTFAPATLPELGPLLQRAIARAQVQQAPVQGQ